MRLNNEIDEKTQDLAVWRAQQQKPKEAAVQYYELRKQFWK